MDRIDAFAIARRLATETPLIEPSALAAMLALARNAPDETKLAEHARLTAFRAEFAPKIERQGDIAILSIEGTLMRRPSLGELLFLGAEDSGVVRQQVREVAGDPAVKGVLLRVDSPGGMLTGTPELAGAVAALRKVKPVVAYSEGLMASAAYWIGAQADKIVASESARLGSIGVYLALYDLSAYFKEMGVGVEVIKNKEGDLKAIGVPGTSLTTEQRSYLEARVQADFALFRSRVKAARPGVPEGAMRGQTFSGRENIAEGFADFVGDESFALSVLRREIRTR